jgi:hypothetical protein
MPRPLASRRYDAALHLLDRQLIDSDGRLVAKVDDLEIRETDDGRLEVTALLTGPAALGPRLGGHLGAWMVSVWSRLRSDERPTPGRIELARVSGIDSAVHLDRPRRSFEVDGLERWVEQNVIDPLPGAGHAPE